MEQQDNAEQPVKPIRMKFSEKPPPENHRDYLDMDTDEEEFGHQGIYMFCLTLGYLHVL